MDHDAKHSPCGHLGTSRPLNDILCFCITFCIYFWYFLGFRLQTAFVPQPSDGKASQEGLNHSKMSSKQFAAIPVDHGAKHSPYGHLGTSRPLNGILEFCNIFCISFWSFVGFRFQTAIVAQPSDAKASQEGLKRSKMSSKQLGGKLMVRSILPTVTWGRLALSTGFWSFAANFVFFLILS